MLIISSLFLFLLLYSLKFLKQQYQIWCWQRRLQLKKHLTHFRTLNQHINGFELSRQMRIESDAYEYVYGEIVPQSFIALLSLTEPDENTVFYDLGSGIGKAVLAAAMVFDLKKACGIELFEPLHQAAQKQVTQLQQSEHYAQKISRIEFICSNFLTTNLSDATLIFISATGLFGEIWEQLNHHLEQLEQPPLIITTSKKLISPHFKVLHQTHIQMSWGVVKAYIQRSIIDS